MAIKPIDISQEEFLKRFGFDPYAAQEVQPQPIDEFGNPVPEVMPEEMAPPPTDEVTPDPSQQWESDIDSSVGGAPMGDPTPEGIEPVEPVPSEGQEGRHDPGPGPGMDASLQFRQPEGARPPPTPPPPPGMPGSGGVNRAMMRSLLTREGARKIYEQYQNDPEAFGRFSQPLAETEDFYSAHSTLVRDDPQYRDMVVGMMKKEAPKRVSDTIGGRKPVEGEELPTREDMIRDMIETRNALDSPERKEALKVGKAAARDMAMLADVADDMTGKQDGVNERYRVDMTGVIGLARVRIQKPLEEQGDMDGATKFDEFLDAMSDDILQLAKESYHPNAFPVRVALQLRMDIDKNPALAADSSFGRALRQFRNILGEVVEDKVAAARALSPEVDAEGFSRAMEAYDDALQKMLATQPTSWLRMARRK